MDLEHFNHCMCYKPVRRNNLRLIFLAACKITGDKLLGCHGYHMACVKQNSTASYFLY